LGLLSERWNRHDIADPAAAVAIGSDLGAREPPESLCELDRGCVEDQPQGSVAETRNSEF
jgi:hypothetical protein